MKALIRHFFSLASFSFVCFSLEAYAQSFTPDTVPDLILWLDAADVNGNGSMPHDGTLISTWTDKSGNGAHATEESSLAQPTLQLHRFGCMPGIYFDNLPSGLEGQVNRPNGQDFTLFMVARMGPANIGRRNTYIEITTGFASQRSIFFQNSVHPTYLRSRINIDKLQVLRWTESAPNSDFSIYEDGVANTVNASKNSDDWNVVGFNVVEYHLGDDLTGGDEMLDGHINEVLMYDRILTAQEITDIETYLSTRWQNQPVCSPAELEVTKTASTYNLQEYAIPGNDIVYSFSMKNIGGTDMDGGSIFLVETIPSEMELFTGDFNNSNSGMGPIDFSSGATGLSFNPSQDYGVSFGITPPQNMNQCNDTPNGDYDPRIRFLCVNPKGIMASGNPAPEAALSFRARIK